MNRQSIRGITYTVHTGESLYSISRRYHVTIAEISRENPFIDIYNLVVGDEIYLPVGNGPKDRVIEYTVKKDETIRSVLTKFNLELEDLLKYNDLETLKLVKGMVLHIPTQDYETIQVL